MMKVDLTVNRWRFIIGSEREAERAKMMMDGQVVEGRSITVTFH